METTDYRNPALQKRLYDAAKSGFIAAFLTQLHKERLISASDAAPNGYWAGALAVEFDSHGIEDTITDFAFLLEEEERQASAYLAGPQRREETV